MNNFVTLYSGVLNNSNNDYSKNMKYRGNFASNKFAPKLKNDVFFKGINKSYNMNEAKTPEDIPADANIFFYYPKAKVKTLEGRTARECIISDKGLSWFERTIGLYNRNTIKIKDCNIDYLHGDLINDKPKTVSSAKIENCSLDQINKIYDLDISDSNVNLIDECDNLALENSKIKSANVEWATVLKGGVEIDTLKTRGLNLTSGNKIKNLESECIVFNEDSLNEDYIELDNAKAFEVELHRAKVNNLDCSNFVLKDSFVKNLNGKGCVTCDNSSVDNMSLVSMYQMSNSKIKNLKLCGHDSNIKMSKKIQINNMSIQNGDLKLFILPSLGWKIPKDNYIKSIKVINDPKINDPDLEREFGCESRTVKVQGDINIGTVEFIGRPGVLKLTSSKNSNTPKVINGNVLYNEPKEELPEEVKLIY